MNCELGDQVADHPPNYASTLRRVVAGTLSAAEILRCDERPGTEGELERGPSGKIASVAVFLTLVTEILAGRQSK